MVVLSTRTADATGVGMSEMDVTMIVVKNKDRRMRWWLGRRDIIGWLQEKNMKALRIFVKRSRSRGSEG
jgi:hypothetical protein